MDDFKLFLGLEICFLFIYLNLAITHFVNFLSLFILVYFLFNCIKKGEIGWRNLLHNFF